MRRPEPFRGQNVKTVFSRVVDIVGTSVLTTFGEESNCARAEQRAYR